MTQVNRIKYEEAKVKLFDGRSKVAEIDLSSLPDKEYFAKVDALEEALESKLKWKPEDGQWKAGKEGEPCEVVDIEKFLKGAKPKSEEKKPRQKRDPNAPQAKKRMKIMKEQRSRRTERTAVEDALDAYVIDMIKSRRTLMYDRLVEVAKENGITIKGEDNGHRKMNVQNVLRGREKRGEDCFINGKKIKPRQ